MFQSNNKKLIGNIGEELACGYLGGKGYKIIDRNFHTRFGELDIIAISPLKTLVFIEVKTMVKVADFNTTDFGSYPHISGNSGICSIKPEDQLSTSKIARFIKISQWYANQNQNISGNGYRLDAICIDLSSNLETALDIRHYESIVEV